MKHIHTFESFLNESELNEKNFERNNYFYTDDYDEFLAKLEELWGKKKSEWTVTKDWKKVSSTKKFTSMDTASYSINNLNIGSWEPKRPSLPAQLPPGAVNLKTNMTFSDLVYPRGSRMD